VDKKKEHTRIKSRKDDDEKIAESYNSATLKVEFHAKRFLQVRINRYEINVSATRERYRRISSYCDVTHCEHTG